MSRVDYHNWVDAMETFRCCHTIIQAQADTTLLGTRPLGVLIQTHDFLILAPLIPTHWNAVMNALHVGDSSLRMPLGLKVRAQKSKLCIFEWLRVDL